MVGSACVCVCGIGDRRDDCKKGLCIWSGGMVFGH